MISLNKITRHEKVLAAAVGVLVTLSPLSGTYIPVSIAVGLAVSLLVLGYRAYLGIPQQSVTAPGLPESAVVSWRESLPSPKRTFWATVR